MTTNYQALRKTIEKAKHHNYKKVVMRITLAEQMLDERDAAEKRIAELEVSHSKLRETMAALHNTIRGNGGAYTSLSMIMSVTKRASVESAAAGITVKGDRA